MTSVAAAEQSIRRSGALMGVALALLAGIYVRALAFTPVEAVQGPAQKIFYVHVPSAWVAFLAFGLVGVCSVVYLIVRDPRVDRFAACSAEVGTVFTTGVLLTGPMWGKPIWGTWWTWDARLTSTLFLWFIFFGYLVLRSAVHEPGQRARFSAVLGILGAMLVPFIHVSVYLFRTLHPQPVVLKPEGPTLPASMLITLLASFAVFTFFFVTLVWQRYAQALLEEARLAVLAEREEHR
jgi:heme exporter protein C